MLRSACIPCLHVEGKDLALRSLAAWMILLVVFLLAGEGFNLFRVHAELWLAFGQPRDAWWAVFGVLLGLGATAWLGGFIYYRDKKRGKLGKRARRSRPTHAPPRDVL